MTTDTPISDDALMYSEPHGYAVVPHCVAQDLERHFEVAQKLAAQRQKEIEFLRAIIERLGSSETFTSSRWLDKVKDAELLARIDYARSAIDLPSLLDANTPVQKAHVCKSEAALSHRLSEINSLRARNDKLYADYKNEQMLRYAAEDEVKAETKRCAQVARDFPFSPANGRAIAALIMEGR